MINIDFATGKYRTKTAKIYESIKEQILSGNIKAGEKIPSKRELSEHLGVSIITVENAYGMLEDEGYIYSKARSGFYVSHLKILRASSTMQKEIELLAVDEIPVSMEKQPDLARYIRRVLSANPELIQMSPPGKGCAVLRNAIALYLHRYRNMDVLPAHIIIGSGAEYLYGMIVQLLGRDKCYGIESPSYEKIESVYRANGAVIEHLFMGEDGIRSDALHKSKSDALHVTPYHSYPTGVTASAQKRYEYLAWARSRDAVIVEDDFDSEFAYFKKPIDPLFSLDTEQRTIYMNTFSKSISPAIRIAYMILPERLVDQYSERLGFYTCPVPVLEQYMLAEYISDGGFERHLARLRHRRP